jgi:hypothetical protein
MTMENDNTNDTRIRARDSASRMLNRITAGVAFSAVAGVGLLGAVSAHVILGVATSTQVASSSASTSSGSTTTSGTTSSGVQPSPTPVSSSPSSGVAVSGGS